MYPKLKSHIFILILSLSFLVSPEVHSSGAVRVVSQKSLDQFYKLGLELLPQVESTQYGLRAIFESMLAPVVLQLGGWPKSGSDAYKVPDDKIIAANPRHNDLVRYLINMKVGKDLPLLRIENGSTWDPGVSRVLIGLGLDDYIIAALKEGGAEKALEVYINFLLFTTEFSNSVLDGVMKIPEINPLVVLHVLALQFSSIGLVASRAGIEEKTVKESLEEDLLPALSPLGRRAVVDYRSGVQEDKQNYELGRRICILCNLWDFLLHKVYTFVAGSAKKPMEEDLDSLLAYVIIRIIKCKTYFGLGNLELEYADLFFVDPERIIAPGYYISSVQTRVKDMEEAQVAATQFLSGIKR